MPTIAFLVGSLRAASSSRALADTLATRLPDGHDAVFPDIGALPHYNADIGDDQGVEALKSAIDGAAGVVIVSPEYNYSIPGLLKNAIDWASRPAFESVFAGKPCLVVTVSGGGLGGVRAQSHLKYVLNGMLARVFPAREIVVPSANAKVTDGAFEDGPILSFASEQLTDFIATLDA
jgi:chromate reductase